MSHGPRRGLAKWDAANAKTMRKHNISAGGTWDDFASRQPGPSWAYAVLALPVISWVGVVAILRARRRARLDANEETREAIENAEPGQPA